MKNLRMMLYGGFTGVLFLLSITLHAHPLDNWHERFINALGSTFNSVAYGNGRFVAVGSSGLVGTSTNGQNWATNFPTTMTLNAVTFGNGQFVAVGLQSTILTSTNGTDWILRHSNPTNFLINVKYDQSRFVAIGVFGFAMTSDDGIGWSVQNSTSHTQDKWFAAGNGLFARVESRGTNLLTMDGTNWWRQFSGTNDNLYTIGFGNGMFVEITINNRVFTSHDATNWTFRGTVPVGRLEDMAFGNGCWVAVGRGSSPVYSPDLKEWHLAKKIDGTTSVTYGNGTFIATAFRIIQSDPVLRLQIGPPNHLLLYGPTNVACDIQATENLSDTNSWLTVTNIFLNAYPVEWSDPESGNHTHRFYRGLLP